MPPLAGYVRVSRRGKRQGDSYISPTVQREKIEGWARLHDLELAEIVLEEDVSGARKVNDRELGRLIAACESGTLSGIVVYRLDRFARSLVETVSAVHRLREANARFIGVDDGVDTARPGGKLVIAVLAAIAEEQLDRIRDGWRDAHERAIGRGVHHPAYAPFGYTRGPGGLLADPVTGQLVKAAFRRRAAGESLAAIARFLTGSTGSGPQDANVWHTASVRNLIRNRVYLGEARYGTAVKVGAHEPLVDERTWTAAQHVRAKDPLRSSEGAQLAGLVRCAGCRYALQRTIPRSDRNDRREYRCRRLSSSGPCPHPVTIGVSMLDDYIIEEVFAALEPGGRLYSPTDSDETAGLRAALDEASAEYDSFVTEMSITDLGRDAFLAGARTRESRRDEAQRALDEAVARTVVNLPTAHELRGLWPGLSVDQRRRILAGGIDMIFVRKGRGDAAGRVSILWRGEGRGVVLPRRGSVVAVGPWVDRDERDAVDLL